MQKWNTQYGERMLVLIEFLLKWFNCDTVNYLCWERIPNTHDAIEEKVLRFIRPKRLPMILKLLLRGACEIGSYIVVYVDIIKIVENFKHLNWSLRSLRLNKLSKSSSFSCSS